MSVLWSRSTVPCVRSIGGIEVFAIGRASGSSRLASSASSSRLFASGWLLYSSEIVVLVRLKYVVKIVRM